MEKLLTGDRPTGPLHLGHYVGTLKNRVRFQHDYDCYFIIADLHMLTTKNTRSDIAEAASNSRALVLDALAAGIEPKHATFYLQSAVPGIGELNTLFQNLVTVPRLERIPSLKEMARAADKSEMPYGLLGYPVLQAADILCVQSSIVPVGKDNAPHVEIAREIARRFNSLYGEVFPIPTLMAGDVPSLPGTDGSMKMSKSLGNAILLSDSAEVVKKKIRAIVTDTNRIRADIPGRVEGNALFIYQRIFNPYQEEVDGFERRYRQGTVGDVEIKENLTKHLNNFLDPIRERRASYEARPGFVDQLIVEGTEKVRGLVDETLRSVRSAMGLSSTWNSLRRKSEKLRSGMPTASAADRTSSPSDLTG